MIKDKLIKRLAEIDNEITRNKALAQQYSNEINNLTLTHHELIGAKSECNAILNHLFEEESN